MYRNFPKEKKEIIDLESAKAYLEQIACVEDVTIKQINPEDRHEYCDVTFGSDNSFVQLNFVEGKAEAELVKEPTSPTNFER